MMCLSSLMTKERTYMHTSTNLARTGYSSAPWKQTKSSIHNACTMMQVAQHIQDIIMCLSLHDYSHITAHNCLPDSPITWNDIAAADDIFGTNVCTHKGKIISSPGTVTDGRLEPVAPEIMKGLQDINLFIDIMYVNRVPFLIMLTWHLHFATIEYLENQCSNTIGKAINRVINIYTQRGSRLG